MHRLCDAAVSGNRLIVRRHQYMIGVARRFVNPRYLQHDQADAAAGARFLISHQCGVDGSVDRQSRVMARRHDSILERAAADAQWPEKMRQFGHLRIVVEIIASRLREISTTMPSTPSAS